VIGRATTGWAWALSTAAWMLWIPFYHRFPTWWGGILLAAAVVVAILADRRTLSTGQVELTGPLVAATAAAGGCLFLPVGLAVALSVGAAGAIVLRWGGRWRRTGATVRGVGTLAVVQGLVVSAFAWGLATRHASAFVSFFDHLAARAVGLDVSAVGPTLSVVVGGEYTTVTPSWDQFGLIYVVLIAVGWVVWRALRGESVSIRTALAVVGGSFAYGLVRHVGILLLTIELGDPTLFWRPVIALTSFAPLLALLATRRPGSRSPSGSRTSGPIVRVWPARVLVLVGAAALAVGLHLQPPGEMSTGRVLFDEAHGDWESTLRPMDTEWYGMPSTYNYHSLYVWLSHYYEVGQITEPLDGARLEPDDVLVLKTPSIPYSEGEVDAIEAHVRAGGGLFAIGDHTNVFGTTSVLNPVLARFGLALNYDATYRLRDGSFSVFRSPPFTLDPIMQRVDSFEFLTSCSLWIPAAARRVMRDGRIITNQADYATRDFFSPDRFALSSTFGVFDQAAATACGRGRVVAFTDSTCFSNFSIHMDGYPDFLLGTIAYLQPGNARFPLRPIALAVAGLSLAIAGVLFGRGRGRTEFPLLVAVAVIGWCAAAGAIAGLHARWYPVPEATESIPYVYFDCASADASISPQPAISGITDRSTRFDTLFVWTQRVGLVPSLLDAGRTPDLDGQRPYVLINPTVGLGERRLARIVRYVQQEGGTLVVMGRPRQDRAAIAGLLGPFDLDLDEAAAGALILRGADIVEHEVSPAMTLPVSSARSGSGRIVLVGDSAAFSDLSFGGTFTVPSDVQRRLYDIAFDLVRWASEPAP